MAAIGTCTLAACAALGDTLGDARFSAVNQPRTEWQPAREPMALTVVLWDEFEHPRVGSALDH